MSWAEAVSGDGVSLSRYVIFDARTDHQPIRGQRMIYISLVLWRYEALMRKRRNVFPPAVNLEADKYFNHC